MGGRIRSGSDQEPLLFLALGLALALGQGWLGQLGTRGGTVSAPTPRGQWLYFQILLLFWRSHKFGGVDIFSPAASLVVQGLSSAPAHKRVGQENESRYIHRRDAPSPTLLHTAKCHGTCLQPSGWSPATRSCRPVARRFLFFFSCHSCRSCTNGLIATNQASIAMLSTSSRWLFGSSTVFG